MLVFTILFCGLFLQEICALFDAGHYPGPVDPEPKWDEEYKDVFNKLGVGNFPLMAGHILHGLTVEDAITSLNIKIPINNKIPAGNPDLSADESNAVLANVPSRPSGYSSSGLHGFVDFMDHVTHPDWTIRNDKLLRLFHVFHMHETFAVARKAADGFSGVSEDICIGALDHENNGIEKGISIIFRALKNESEKLAFDKPLTWDDNGKSWTKYKAGLLPLKFNPAQIKSMGLYTQCLMRKFRQTEQPIGLDGCCDSKTVGAYSYTKVSKGRVPANCLNGCIYRREPLTEGDPDSRYCFAAGDEKVDNTKGCQN